MHHPFPALPGTLLALLLLGAPSASAVELPPFHNPVKPAPPIAPPDEPRPTIELSGSFLFYEDFEHGIQRWRLEGGTPDVHWLLLKARTCGGEYTMLMGRPGQAPFQQARGTAFLTLTTPLDLRGHYRPHLTYDVKATATPANALTLQPEVRLPGGRWKPVGTVARASYRLAFTRFADLTPYARSRIELRFRVDFKPTAAPVLGYYLDNVQVIEPVKASSKRR